VIFPCGVAISIPIELPCSCRRASFPKGLGVTSHEFVRSTGVGSGLAVLGRRGSRAAESCKESLSDQERHQLADRLADAALSHLRRSQELAALARGIRIAVTQAGILRQIAGAKGSVIARLSGRPCTH